MQRRYRRTGPPYRLVGAVNGIRAELPRDCIEWTSREVDLTDFPSTIPTPRDPLNYR